MKRKVPVGMDAKLGMYNAGFAVRLSQSFNAELEGRLEPNKQIDRNAEDNSHRESLKITIGFREDRRGEHE